MNQLKVGTLLSYLKMFVNVIVGLFYVPLILSFLSIEQYGLYQLVASLVAYLAILDFGLSGTITRFFSQKIALKDEVGKENVIAVSLIIYAAISFIIVVAGLILHGLVGYVYHGRLSMEEITEAKLMLLLLVIDLALLIPSHVFTAVLTSYEKFLFLRLLSIVRTLIQPFCVYLLLTVHPFAMSIVITQVVLDVCVILMTVLFAFKTLHLRIRLHSFEKTLVTSMLTFSLFVFINIIVDQVYWGTGQLILGVVAGTASVAVFSIAIQFNNYVSQFSTAIISVLLPKVTRIASTSDDMEELNVVFLKIGRIQFYVIGLLISGFFIFGETFITLWVGDEFRSAYGMALVIMIPFAIDLTISLGNLILQAKNLHSRRSLILTISALLNVALSIPLSIKFGGMGCAIAIGASLFIGNGIVMLGYYAKIGLNIRKLGKEIMRLLGITGISGAIGYILMRMLNFQSWLMLIVEIVAYVFLYVCFMWFFGFNSEEKRIVHSLINRIRMRG